MAASVGDHPRFSAGADAAPGLQPFASEAAKPAAFPRTGRSDVYTPKRQFNHKKLACRARLALSIAPAVKNPGKISKWVPPVRIAPPERINP